MFSTALSDAAAACSCVEWCMGLLLQLEVVESQWLQRESELEQERMEIRQMAITFKQVQIIIQTLPAVAATTLLLSLHFSCLCNGSISFSCCCCFFLFGKGGHRQVLQPSCSSLEDWSLMFWGLHDDDDQGMLCIHTYIYMFFVFLWRAS